MNDEKQKLTLRRRKGTDTTTFSIGGIKKSSKPSKNHSSKLSGPALHLRNDDASMDLNSTLAE